MENLEAFAPVFEKDGYSEEETRRIRPFFTNLDRSVFVPFIASPELVGALCSRTSRAEGDLRMVFLKEYINPFLDPVREKKDTDETWAEKIAYGKELEDFIAFMESHKAGGIFSNPRARSFYVKWLSQ